MEKVLEKIKMLKDSNRCKVWEKEDEIQSNPVNSKVNFPSLFMRLSELCVYAKLRKRTEAPLVVTQNNVYASFFKVVIPVIAIHQIFLRLHFAMFFCQVHQWQEFSQSKINLCALLACLFLLHSFWILKFVVSCELYKTNMKQKQCEVNVCYCIAKW